jgi:hypothetical protein
MQIALVINVVNVKSAEPFATERSDDVSGISADECRVSYVKARSNNVGCVQGIYQL